jgi:hypothetical protein
MVSPSSAASAPTALEARITAEAKKAGLSAQEVADLQGKVDAELKRAPAGAKQISVNQVVYRDGAVITLALPGEKRARAVAGTPNCPYGSACLEHHTVSSDDWTTLLSRPPRQGSAHWYTPRAMIARTMAILHSGIAAGTSVVDSPLNTAQPLCRSLAVAVQRLETRSDADYGTIPRASFELAARLEDCAASSP